MSNTITKKNYNPIFEYVLERFRESEITKDFVDANGGISNFILNKVDYEYPYPDPSEYNSLEEFELYIRSNEPEIKYKTADGGDNLIEVLMSEIFNFYIIPISVIRDILDRGNLLKEVSFIDSINTITKSKVESDEINTINIPLLNIEDDVSELKRVILSNIKVYTSVSTVVTKILLDGMEFGERKSDFWKRIYSKLESNINELDKTGRMGDYGTLVLLAPQFSDIVDHVTENSVEIIDWFDNLYRKSKQLKHLDYINENGELNGN